MFDPTQRFTGRVHDYIRYRPGYPPEVLDLLRRECNLTESSEFADIGSGTGILARLLLDNGNRVVMVEPNDEMRQAGERLLSGYRRLDSVAAMAEATGLPQGSVDFITVGQAFHWFDPVAAREEFTWVLRPGGKVMLVWNARRKAEKPFLEDYEGLLNAFATDYLEVEHGKVSCSEAIHNFFAPNDVYTAPFDHTQVLDHDGLRGRLRSSSYIPAEGAPGYQKMLEELERVFAGMRLVAASSSNTTRRFTSGRLRLERARVFDTLVGVQRNISESLIWGIREPFASAKVVCGRKVSARSHEYYR